MYRKGAVNNITNINFMKCLLDFIQVSCCEITKLTFYEIKYVITIIQDEVIATYS